MCDKLYECFFFTLDQGLRNGGGIGDAIFQPSFELAESDFFARLVFDLTFFGFVCVILLNGVVRERGLGTGQVFIMMAWHHLVAFPSICDSRCPPLRALTLMPVYVLFCRIATFNRCLVSSWTRSVTSATS